LKLARAVGLIAYACILFALQLRVAGNLGTDGVAYLRQAQYWAHWQADLMISAYWSPGFSWLIAAFMRFGADDLIALRLAMTAGAVVFVIGCARLFAVMHLSRTAYIAALLICAVSSLGWGITFLSPDLLVTGLLYCAIALLVRGLEQHDSKRAAFAGLLFGIAFLAKAIALPLAFALTAGYLFVTWRRTGEAFPRLLRVVTVAVVTTIAVAAPWIGVISAKRHRLTMSTSGAINHAILSPDNPWVDRMRPHRYHPVIQTFHRPEPGRVTSWEDPSDAPYRYWSPFASRRNFRHQLHISGTNAAWAFWYLSLFDWAYITPAIVLLAAAAVFRRGGGSTMRVLQLAGIACGAFFAAYLPVYGKDFRYYIPLFPFALGALAACHQWLVQRPLFRDHQAARLGLVLALALAYLPPVIMGVIATTDASVTEASATAQWVANALEETGHAGPIAGSAHLQDGGDIGLYIAYLLGEPWYGDERYPSFARLEALKPRLVIAVKGSPFAEALAHEPAFIDLDPVLKPRAKGRPLHIKVFAMRTKSERPTRDIPVGLS
jgi:4-amino-4-deoxy-L-arabinose transferase-like glycosyltransferase